MSLFHPTPGEIADRLSILEMKIAALEKAGKNPVDLQRECNFCIEALTQILSQKRGRGEQPKVYDLLEKLKAINKVIWDLVDEIHGLYEGDMVNAGRIGIQIAQQNDIRFGLVREINYALGAEVEEKVYTR